MLYAGYTEGLIKGIDVGDVVMVKDAVPDEGVTRMYMPSVELIETGQELMSLVMEKLRAINIKYHVRRI